MIVNHAHRYGPGNPLFLPNTPSQRSLCRHPLGGRYRYYACSARCGQAAIKEAALSVLFLELVKAIHITEVQAAGIMEAIKEFESVRKTEQDERVTALQEKHRKLRANIAAAYDDKLSGKIAEDFWLRRTRWGL